MKQWPSDKNEYAAETASGGEPSFNGFKNLNSTPIPDEFFDILAVQLSEAELRVLLYIMRRTFGFKKKADAISLSQLTGGIRKRDGSVLDHGTGLSKPAVLKAISGLQAKGIITIEKRTGEDGRNEINVYQLRFADEPVTTPQSPKTGQIYNSIADYPTAEHNLYPSPDPRFVSARPVAPGNNRPTSPGFFQGVPGEQRQGGDFKVYNSDTFEGESEITPGVNQVYYGGKPNLPWAKIQTQGSKPALPGVVNQLNRDSQAEAAKGVNLVNRQHESLQESRKQNTETQTVWRANGSLAYQTSLLDEPADNTQAEELYINLEELASEMYELGLSQKLVFDFIQAYPANYLWEKIQMTRQQLQGHQPTVKNSAGYLRRAITEDYRPQPKIYRNPRSASSDFTARFQGTLAYLNKSSGQLDESYIEPPYSGYSFEDAVSEDTISYEEPATGLWEKIYEDLEGRFRLGDSLELLQGALLFLPGPDDCENYVTLQLVSPWQERALGMAARSAISLAVRQRLGPGFKVKICSA